MPDGRPAVSPYPGRSTATAVWPRAAKVARVGQAVTQVWEVKAAPCSSTTTRPVALTPGGGPARCTTRRG